MSDEPEKYIGLSISDLYVTRLEAENAKLREIIAECADDFYSAAEGNGINFYQCAIDLRETLTALGGRND